jgi:hypothetical protein
MHGCTIIGASTAPVVKKKTIGCSSAMAGVTVAEASAAGAETAPSAPLPPPAEARRAVACFPAGPSNSEKLFSVGRNILPIH